MGWNKLDITYRERTKRVDIERPSNLDEMLTVASTLSSEFDFVRVDLYSCKNKVIFGEMTFTPVAGLIKFEPKSWDLLFGQKWK